MLAYKIKTLSDFLTETTYFALIFYARIAVNCGDPTATLGVYKQNYQGGPSFPSTTTEGSSWIIECQPGYRWVDGSSFKFLNCNYSGLWNYQTTCSGT